MDLSDEKRKTGQIAGELRGKAPGVPQLKLPIMPRAELELCAPMTSCRRFE
jgi:hypothetical protein